MPALDTNRILARNTIWNYMGFVVNLATNLFMFPYVVYHIGGAAAGVWLLLGSVTGYMGLLELGVVPSLTQAVAAASARNDRDGVSRATSSALAILLVLAVMTLLLLPAAPIIVGVLRVPVELEVEVLAAFRVTLVGFALRMPLAAFQAVLLGRQRQDRCSQLWIGMAIAKLAAAAGVLGAGYGLVGLVLSEATIHALAGVYQIKWTFSEVPELRLSWRLVGRADIKALTSFGSAMVAVTICSLLIEQTDRIVIALFLPIAMVTYYAAAWKIYMLAYAVTTTFVHAVSPLAADLHARGDYEGLRALFLRSTKYTAALAWPLVLTLGMTGGFLLRVWMGPDFIAALPVVQVLFAAFLVTVHNHAGYSALIGMRRVGPTVRLYFAPQALLNVVLSVWLVQHLGIVGVAVGTAVPALALEFFYLRFLLAELRVTWKGFLARAVLPVATPAVLCYAPLAITYLRTDSASPLLLIVACACSALYVAVLVRFLEPDERSTVLAYLGRYVRPRRAWPTHPVTVERGPGA